MSPSPGNRPNATQIKPLPCCVCASYPMDFDSCSCPLPSIASLDDWVVLFAARGQVCVVYLLTLRCLWVTFGNRAALREVTWLQEWRRSLVDAWQLAFGSSSADPFARKVEDRVDCVLQNQSVSWWEPSGPELIKLSFFRPAHFQCALPRVIAITCNAEHE